MKWTRSGIRQLKFFKEIMWYFFLSSIKKNLMEILIIVYGIMSVQKADDVTCRARVGTQFPGYYIVWKELRIIW